MAPRPWRWPTLVTCFRATIRFTQSWKRACSNSVAPCDREQRGDDTSQIGEVDRLMPIEGAMHRRERIFQTACAVKQHDLVGALHTPVFEALLVGRIGRRAFRA